MSDNFCISKSNLDDEEKRDKGEPVPPKPPKNGLPKKTVR